MDKENGPGDHLKKQTLGDEEEKSPQTPAILAALNLIKIKEVNKKHVRIDKEVIISCAFRSFRTKL
uniref:GG16722 n=1 Tax=Drosophila erecta TaxID=7220 RepID=B3P5T1_DROER